MPEPEGAILLGFAWLAVKHCLADFILQTPYQYQNKGIYGHPGGLLHAGIHVLLTAPLFLILPAAGPGAALAILIGEYAVHYHVDWLKEQVVKRYALVADTTGFWYALGIDQLAHQFTYIAIVWLLIGNGI